MTKSTTLRFVKSYTSSDINQSGSIEETIVEVSENTYGEYEFSLTHRTSHKENDSYEDSQEMRLTADEVRSLCSYLEDCKYNEVGRTEMKLAHSEHFIEFEHLEDQANTFVVFTVAYMGCVPNSFYLELNELDIDALIEALEKLLK